LARKISIGRKIYMKKYLVICVSEGEVRSVYPFDTEKEAYDALATDAKETYEKIEESPTSTIYVAPGTARVADGYAVWHWSVHPLIL